MKRFITLLTIVSTMLFNTISASAFDTIDVLIDSKTAYVGDTVEINIELENNSGILAMLFELTYDTDRLQLIEAKSTDMVDGAMFSQTVDTYPYVMLWNSASYTNFTEDGVLAVLKFKVLDSAPMGEAFINISYDDENVYDVDLQNVVLNVQNGGIAISSQSDSDDSENTSDSDKLSNNSGGSNGSGLSVSTYTITFDTNGGSVIDNIKATRNKKIDEPIVPTKDGYIFEGWYTDEDLTNLYDFSMKITNDITLYAKWTEVKTDDEKSDDTEKTDVSETLSFVDVKENDWFYENVKYVVENKLMNGVSENQFSPNNTLTRAMLVTVLYRNAGEPVVNKSIPFADVDMGAWYADAVVWAKQNGIVNGVTENEFAPDANITREQIATIMFRYAQYKGMDAVTLEENLHFADANEISEYAVSAMNWAVGTGLMKGKSTTTINPLDNATRAEIAAILQRFIETNN